MTTTQNCTGGLNHKYLWFDSSYKQSNSFPQPSLHKYIPTPCVAGVLATFSDLEEAWSDTLRTRTTSVGNVRILSFTYSCQYMYICMDCSRNTSGVGLPPA